MLETVTPEVPFNEDRSGTFRPLVQLTVDGKKAMSGQRLAAGEHTAADACDTSTKRGFACFVHRVDPYPMANSGYKEFDWTLARPTSG